MLPLSKRHHLLLVSLLLTYVTCVVVVPLLLDRVLPLVAAILISIFAFFVLAGYVER